MKNITKIGLFLGILVLINPLSVFAKAPRHTVGRILLQVESHGEAWYVSPTDETRTYLPDGNAAYSALENYGLGITNADLEQIPIGIEDRFEDYDSDHDGLADKLEEAIGTNPNNPDSDGDSYMDGNEVRLGYDPLGPGMMVQNAGLVDQLQGRILLQVQSRGQAWYINPEDGKRYYMKNGDAAYQIMRNLSLGITNSDLNEIPQNTTKIDCADNIFCYRSAVENNQPALVNWDTEFSVNGVWIAIKARLDHEGPDEEGYYLDYIALENLDFSVEGEALQWLLSWGLTQEDVDEGVAALNQEIDTENENTRSVCKYSDPVVIINIIDRLEAGDYGALANYEEELNAIDIDCEYIENF